MPLAPHRFDHVTIQFRRLRELVGEQPPRFRTDVQTTEHEQIDRWKAWSAKHDLLAHVEGDIQAANEEAKQRERAERSRPGVDLNAIG